jgi:hypothetical protein
MSFHNMRGFGDPRFTAPSEKILSLGHPASESDPDKREALLAVWSDAPSGRLSHPRDEHLLPLTVAAGASRGNRRHLFRTRHGDSHLRFSVRIGAPRRGRLRLGFQVTDRFGVLHIACRYRRQPGDGRALSF